MSDNFKRMIKTDLYVGVVIFVSQYIKYKIVGNDYNLKAYVLIYISVALVLGLLLLIINKMLKRKK